LPAIVADGVPSARVAGGRSARGGGAATVDAMKPWETLAITTTPDGSTLQLRRHDDDYVIRAEGYDLMTSRQHGSEDAMMALACPHPRADASVLVGGLGMGYTLAATLTLLPPTATVVVSELVPAVVDWNRGPLADLAGRPLDDPRTEIALGDVAEVIRKSAARFDAILLDVGNGPDAFTQRGNAWLYGPAGLAAIGRALRAGGALGVWSVRGGMDFERPLRAAGFTASTHAVAAHGRRGPRHIVFIGRKR
jgi:spermidine synthase